MERNWTRSSGNGWGRWGMRFDVGEQTLGDIADITMGQSPKGETCNPDGIGVPLLNGPTEFGFRHPDPVQFTTDPKRFADPGDLLFCVRGSTTGRMNWANQQYAIGRGIAGIRGKNGFPTTYVRATIEYRLDSLLVSATGSTFPNVGRRMLTELSIPEHDAPTAIGISQILDGLDRRIWNLTEVNFSLESIAQAIFKSWFIDFDPVHVKAAGQEPPGMDAETAALFPSEIEGSELGPIPKGWRPGSLLELASLSRDSVNPSRAPDTLFEHYSIPAYDSGQMPILEHGSEIKSNKYLVQSGTVLQSRLNPRIPRSWLIGEVGSHAVCSTEFLVWLPNADVPRGYIYCLLTSPSFMEQVEALATGTSGSHQRVRPEHISNLSIVIPPQDVLKAFGRVVKPLFENVIRNREQIPTLAALRDTLLPRLISGRLRIPEAEEIVEEAVS